MAELIWVLICRSAQDREDGDLDAIGILDRLSLDVFPTELTPLVLVASWRNDRAIALPVRVRQWLDRTLICETDTPIQVDAWRPRSGYWTAGMLLDIGSKPVKEPCQMKFEILDGDKPAGSTLLEIGYPLVGVRFTLETVS